jgi:hypothetical protein
MVPIWTKWRREDNAGTRPCSSASNLGWNWGRSGNPDFRRIPAQRRGRTAINPDDGTRSAFLVRESLPVPGKVANEVCHGDWNYSWFSGQWGLADEQGRMK